MIIHSRAPLTCVVLTLCFLSSFAQSQSKPEPQAEENIVIGTSEVLLDAVVKDKKGHPVKNLAQSDFEVFEDGVRQQVTSFRLVSPDTLKDSSKTGEVDKSTPQRTLPRSAQNRLSAVAVVFDRLSADARARARAAALDYLSQELAGDEYVGIFSINLSLRVLQPYTNNLQLARRGIESAGGEGSAIFSSTKDQVRDLAEQQSSAENAADAAASSAASSGGVGAAGAAAMADAQLLEMTVRSLETFENLERDQQGYATSNGLIALINSMQRVYGRKAIIFFSEGIAIPSSVQHQFRSVIANANRANVSIYAVDAAGLRTDSPTAETRREMMSSGQRRLAQLGTTREGLSGPMTRGLERNEDLLTLNPESGLGQLADQTGGILISETNGMGPKLRQVNDDLHSYYLLTYVPQNRNYDGRYRQISVKLNHPGLEIQTRKGYYALKADSSPILSYEVPVLAILGSGRTANSFALHAGSFNFPSNGKSSITSILVEVPPGVVTYGTTAEKTYRTDFSIVALIKDESQRVVKKLSNQYVLTGPVEKIEAAKAGGILFYRMTELPPGHYAIITAAYDAISGTASTSTGVLEVPRVDETRLRVSSLTILKRAEKLTEQNQKTNNPFRYGEVLVYPNLGEPLKKSTDKQLTFYLTAYVAQGTKNSPKLMLELRQREQSLGKAALDLPAPDVTGRIQFASALPIDQLQPGNYELKATVSDGTSSISRSEHFAVQ